MPTLNDVADIAGVSYSAVSQILNNEKRRARFSAKTVDRVLEAAERLGYATNQFAKSLKTGRTGIIGITNSKSVQSGDLFFQPYFSRIYAGLSDALGPAGYRMIMQNNSGKEGADPFVELGRSQITEGLIFILLSDDEELFFDNQLPALQKMDLPFVVVHSLAEMRGCSNVGIDCVTGGMKVVDHLTDHGLWRNAFVGRTPLLRSYHNLLNGFRQAHQQMGTQFDERNLLFVVPGEDARLGYELADRILQKETELPDSFFCINDWLAQGMIRRFTEAGLKVPGDVAVIGFGELLEQGVFDTGLTSLSQMAFEKGKAAGSMLVELISHGNHDTIFQSEIIDPHLVLRSTCGCNKD